MYDDYDDTDDLDLEHPVSREPDPETPVGDGCSFVVIVGFLLFLGLVVCSIAKHAGFEINFK